MTTEDAVRAGSSGRAQTAFSASGTNPGDAPATCPHCGSAAGPPGAKFCPACGGALRGPACGVCGAQSGGADRFCVHCGSALPSRSGRAGVGGRGLGSGTAAWAVGGLLFGGMIVAIAALAIMRASGGESASPSAAAGQGTPGPGNAPGGLGPTAAVDLSSMTPREAATRLFNRVMGAVEANDQAQAALFLPMAIASYDRIGALTLDDRFHLSLLHAAGGDGSAALATAEAGLAVRPSHLLCLAAAASGALLVGDSAKATAYYQTFLDKYDDELASGLTEYGPPPDGHAPLLLDLRADARAHVAGSR